MSWIQKQKDAVVAKLRGETPLAVLVQRGLTVGKNFQPQKGCILDPSHCWLITIGDDVTLAPRVHILAHDASTKMFLGYTKIGLVTIGNQVFIGANSTILPNCRIGDRVIVGANSVVTKDLPSGGVYAGNPAKLVCSLDDYLEKMKRAMQPDNTFGAEYTISKGVTREQKENMKQILKKGMGFVE